MNNTTKYYDVVIIGGGLAGLSLAIQLKKRLSPSPLSIAVIERMKHPVPDAAHKVGESLVELSAHYFSDVLGLKEHLIKDQLPKLGLRFFFKNADTENDYRSRMEKSVEFGAKKFPHSPSYQLDRGIFENFLAKRCQELGVDFIDDTKVNTVNITEKQAHNSVTAVNLSTNEETTYTCRWLVDACSRMSPIKRHLDLAEESDHKVSSAWFRIGTKMDINDFSTSNEWVGDHTGDNSRWFSTNHFMGNGYWLWFIPLSSGSTSIGIVADNEYHPLETYNTMDKAMEWLRTHEPLCAEHIEKQLDKLQDFRVLRNFSHSCKEVYSADRWFLTGEAGVFLDPFYSPGSDFIAMSNTFICNLIEDDYKDTGAFNKNCFILNLFYLNIFKNTSRIYVNEYAVFGNAKVMPMKILWDFGVYWSFNAFLYIQGKFVDTDGLFAIRRHLEDLGQMNMEMQPFFIEWAKTDKGNSQQYYIDPFNFEFLERLNKGLYEKLDDAQFEQRFMENIQGIKTLYNKMISAAVKENPTLKPPASAVITSGDDNIFTELLANIHAA
jgi:flavin-dependent dehydrogenase